MTKKFFSLIRGESIHLSPESKVIKAQEFSELLSSEGLLEAVKKDAEIYRESVIKECELLKEKAEEKGFDEGLKKWTDQLVKLEQEIAQVRKDVEKMVMPVVLKAIRKILGREIEQSESAVLDIISTNLKAVTHHKNIRIYVSPDNWKNIELNKPKLKANFEKIESLSIIEQADLKPGDCIIETEGGIINAKLETVLQNLERAFEVLARTSSK